MKIAIAGFGVEGRANYDYFKREFPDVEITIADEREGVDSAPEGAQIISGLGIFEKLQGYDMVVRTAGLAPRKIKTDGQIWSATNEFFAKCPAPIIGVTGTKGKGTTCSLIVSILRTAGKTAHLVGNIGVPALDVLPKIKPGDIVVYELSSFQLWDLEKSPQIAVVLMIEPDHLDVHEGFDEYIGAKSNTTRYQTSGDMVIYHPENEYSREIAELGKGDKIRYGTKEDGGVYVKANNFCVQENAICSVDTLHLVGVHNLENACAAISAARQFTADDEAVAEGLSSFAGLPHRLKFVAERGGVKYYDDSISTTPGSAIAALRSFDAPKVIILGGHDKGADYDSVVAACKEEGAQIIAIGQTGAIIHDLAAEQGVKSYRVEGPMSEVVAKAAEVAPEGSVVLLSPASASFGQYKNYADRGEQFVDAVTELRQED